LEYGWNFNGFNSRIGRNAEITKALDIKEDLDINYLMYCKHCINFRHKDDKNDLKQMFQRELACTAVSAHSVQEAKFAGRVKEGGTGTICFGESSGYIKNRTRQGRSWQMELDPPRWNEWAQHVHDHCVQSM
jgi:hypothetical protein